ncbi:bacillithiol system redox-active protein YtxJ [Myroides pelagicus]|uniref:Bacillithiol system redox-active protein YtxJ n=1 Tax=Myroides pelagicus TaxID=270914 RepID=A0A7K1GP80_9FLAO|nr:bacillithiol system redox-active protein YtxJ [Myroides pelagicus]MEC4113945.1 bacillithiol system redox-active protein YtxJ [Myroides pelagicus]MTH30213.1 bacillithiol system redox-active protein YtxJ [Myroides pelagicus]
MEWISLKDKQQLEELVALSQQKPVVIFKNSNRCYISKFALKNFQASFDNSKQVLCYMVDVVADRPISLAIADLFKVEHQSPQILLIAEGKSVFSTSHENIDGAALEKLVLTIA